MTAGYTKGILVDLARTPPLSRCTKRAGDGLLVTLDYRQVGTDGDFRPQSALPPVLQRAHVEAEQSGAVRKFDRLLVWKVSRLGRDMRQVIATVLADLGVTVIPVALTISQRLRSSWRVTSPT